jgi:serine/threonine protein phosphatase 1
MAIERKITWIVGDIHGMYDPLKRLITELRKREKLDDEKVGKIIFIGDYIDYGPSSKEVLDLLIDLEFETVFMAGNHEDMLLHYCKDSYFIKEYGNMWFNGNGGQETVLSFDPDAGVYGKIISHEVGSFFGGGSETFLPGAYQFDKKYMDFFENLVYSHVEVVDDGEKSLKLALSHAALDTRWGLEEQLKLKTFDDFHNFIQEKQVFQKNFNLWSRKEPKEKFEDYILIHGHTPTDILPENYKNLGTFKPESGLPYFKFVKPEIRTGFDEWPATYYFDASLKDLISIDIDTGAVFGNHLTAVGFDDRALWTGEISVLQVASGGMHRGRKADVKEYAIKVNPFGKG